MKYFSNYIKISENYRRSIKISVDKADENFLANYICTNSINMIINSISNHLSVTKHSAFTITGSYGSGKSSFILFLEALLSNNKPIRTEALQLLDNVTKKQFTSKFPKIIKGWRMLSLVGIRGSPILDLAKLLQIDLNSDNTINKILNRLTEISNNSKHDGIVLVFDELGKYLEEAASEEFDIYFFQQLAELSNRSNNKIILIGLLHLAFIDYSRTLSSEQRNEWSKIQGRFIDLPLNMAGEEQLILISNSINNINEMIKIPSSIKRKIHTVAKQIVKNKKVIYSYEELLQGCYPLHPIVSYLLPLISRRRFGQQQRSIFSFLNSAETGSFRTFIETKEYHKDVLFSTADLWEYLQANLETSILVSSDSHKWSTALDAISKADEQNATIEHLDILKTIILIDLFKERLGLLATEEILTTISIPKNVKLQDIIHDLQKWQTIRKNKATNSFVVYVGSDFDIDKALNNAELENRNYELDNDTLNYKIRPVIATKYQSINGTFRWFNVKIIANSQIKEFRNNLDITSSSGYFVLIINSNLATSCEVKKIVQDLKNEDRIPIVYKEISQSRKLVSYCKELFFLNWIQRNNQELRGDKVARREVETRKQNTAILIKNLIDNSLITGEWSYKEKVYKTESLSNIASEILEKLFERSPIIKNELINKIKPSSSANTAIKKLLLALVNNNGVEELGFKEGYPAERGLFDSVIKANALYQNNNIVEPSSYSTENLVYLWSKTDNFIQSEKGQVKLEEIYDLWEKKPIGIKKGLLSLLITVYLITRQKNISIYLDGSYQTNLDRYFIENLFKTPKGISIRWIDLKGLTKEILFEIKSIVITLAKKRNINLPLGDAPLSIAKTLIEIFDSLPAWVLKTQELSSEAINLREVLKKANDPNKVLFDDLPNILLNTGNIDVKKFAQQLQKRLYELINAYPNMINNMWDMVSKSLGFYNHDDYSLINARAREIQGKTGNFSLNAFIMRLATFTGSFEEKEGILSVLINKIPSLWIDVDKNNAEMQLRKIVFEFNMLERLLSFSEGKELNKKDTEIINAMKIKVLNSLDNEDNILKLIALSELGIEIMKGNIDDR